MQLIHLQQKLACHQDNSHSSVIIDETVLCVGLTSTTLNVCAPPQFILETSIDRKTSKISSPCFKEWLSICKHKASASSYLNNLIIVENV